MYRLCRIGLSIIFILSINGVWSQSLCGRLGGSWLFINDLALQDPLSVLGVEYEERKDKMRHTVESEVTPVTPFQAVWYPDFLHPAGGAFNPYSHYLVLKLHIFEGNELSLVDASVKATYMRQLGMLLCKKSNGKCGRDYKGQVSYVENGDEIGIYIIPENRVSLAVHYFINDVLTGDPVRLNLKSFKTLFPAVTFTKPGLVTMIECQEEPPTRLLNDIEFMAGKRAVISYDTLIRYYKSKKPNDAELYNFDKHQGAWVFRDNFVICKTPEDQCKVAKSAKSNKSNFLLEVSITQRSETKISFRYVFYFMRSSETYIKRDLVDNTWSKFSPAIRTGTFGPSDILAFEGWLDRFLASATMLFLGPNGKSLHIADNNCAISFKINKDRRKSLLV